MGNDARKWPAWERLTEDDYRELGRRLTRELRAIVERKEQLRQAKQRRREDQQRPEREGNPSTHD